MIKKCKQTGFILIELLIGIVVVGMLLTWWFNHENTMNRQAIASRTSAEMNKILNAATSYYIEEAQKWPTSVADLITKHFIEPSTPGETVLKSYYGTAYTLTIVPYADSQMLQLSILFPEDAQAIARKVMLTLPFATLTTEKSGEYQLQTSLVEPGITKTQHDTVRYGTIVSSGTVIQKPHCGPDAGFKPAIFASVSSCGDTDANPISACRVYAVADGDTAWKVYMRVLTNIGWQTADPNLGKIEVFTKCQNPTD